MKRMFSSPHLPPVPKAVVPAKSAKPVPLWKLAENAIFHDADRDLGTAQKQGRVFRKIGSNQRPGTPLSESPTYILRTGSNRYVYATEKSDRLVVPLRAIGA
jgi:hypothetical protein